MRKNTLSGFSLFELLMVILLIAILASYVFKSTLDFRQEARLSAQIKTLQYMSDIVSKQRYKVMSHCDLGSDYWPSVEAINANSLLLDQQVIDECAHSDLANIERYSFFEEGVPLSPWSEFNGVVECSGDSCLNSCLPCSSASSDVWCYSSTSGELWSNSSQQVNGLMACSLISKNGYLLTSLNTSEFREPAGDNDNDDLSFQNDQSDEGDMSDGVLSDDSSDFDDVAQNLGSTDENTQANDIQEEDALVNEEEEVTMTNDNSSSDQAPAETQESVSFSCSSKKVALCHVPPGNPLAQHNICVGKGAVNAHLEHGDYLGPCI